MKQSIKKDNINHFTGKSKLGIVINILIFTSIVFLLWEHPDENEDQASAYSDAREVLDPEEHQDLIYNDSEDALTEANTQLVNMTIGNISTLNGNDEDNFTVNLILDHEIGNVYYWELADPETLIHLEANTGEIIVYIHNGWHDGSLTQSEIESKANQIASQFAPLPTDRSEILSEIRNTTTEEVYNPEGEDTSITHDYWCVQYDREKNSITTGDHITMIINKNGYLTSYNKKWFMDLEEFSTSYSVTEEQAKTTALNHAGEGSTFISAKKWIVRPNDFWDANTSFSWGSNPVCIYEVWIKDADDNLCIYQVDGNDNVIIGGDFSFNYYGE